MYSCAERFAKIKAMPDYDLERKLGNGAFGEVWLGDDRALGLKRAIKYVPPANIKDPTNFYEEPQTLVALRHPNVIEITDAGQTATGQLYIAMVYYPNGSISDQMGGAVVPIKYSLRLACDVCRGLEYAHAQGFIHRDIKPANIMIDNQGNGLLSDFGLATRVSVDGTASPYGYLGHLAPEVISDDITDKRTDIYALGVTLYRLVNGDAYLPITIDQNELMDMIRDGNFPNKNKYRPFVPTRVRTVINKALSLNPDDRFQSASDMRHAIERIPIHTSWMPSTIPNGTEWNCQVGSMEYSAKSIRQAHACFDFILEKGKTGKPTRKMHSDKLICAKKGVHESQVRKVLSRIVIDGK